MPNDIEYLIDRTGETMAIHVEGLTEPGVDFLDSYFPSDPKHYIVVDSGRLIVHEDHLDELTTAAREQGLAIGDARADG